MKYRKAALLTVALIAANPVFAAKQSNAASGAQASKLPPQQSFRPIEGNSFSIGATRVSGGPSGSSGKSKFNGLPTTSSRPISHRQPQPPR
jgi:hypothetical protein